MHNYPTVTHFKELNISLLLLPLINTSNTTGATCGTGSAYHSGAPEIPNFRWGSFCADFGFVVVLWTVVCLFVLFVLSHVVFSLFSTNEFECPFGIIRLSFCLTFHDFVAAFPDIKVRSTEDIYTSYNKTDSGDYVIPTGHNFTIECHGAYPPKLKVLCSGKVNVSILYKCSKCSRTYCLVAIVSDKDNNNPNQGVNKDTQNQRTFTSTDINNK